MLRRSVIAAGVFVPADERLLEGQEQRLMARVKGRAFRSGEVFQMRKRRRGLAVGAEHALRIRHACCLVEGDAVDRSEEHTSELQSLMRISYAVFCLKKKKKPQKKH